MIDLLISSFTKLNNLQGFKLVEGNKGYFGVIKVNLLFSCVNGEYLHNVTLDVLNHETHHQQSITFDDALVAINFANGKAIDLDRAAKLGRLHSFQM
jgi:hypothetical protein